MSLLNADGNPMRFNNLGDSGLMVSEISFGTMTFSDVDRAATGTGEGAKAEQAYEILETCYKGGVNFFDCAEGYGYAGAAERVLGEAIQIGLKKGTWDRMVRDSTLSCCPGERAPPQAAGPEASTEPFACRTWSSAPSCTTAAAATETASTRSAFLASISSRA